MVFPDIVKDDVPKEQSEMGPGKGYVIDPETGKRRPLCEISNLPTYETSMALPKIIWMGSLEEPST